MADVPLVSVLEIPQLGAGHEEDPPINPPTGLLVGAIRCGEDASDFRLVGIHVLQPLIGRPAVMPTVHHPMLLESQVFVEVEQ